MTWKASESGSDNSDLFTCVILQQSHACGDLAAMLLSALIFCPDAADPRQFSFD